MTGTLTRLARSASFERRRRSTTDPVKPPEVAKENSNNSGGGIVGKIVRSSSFERKRRSSARKEGKEGTTSEESSGGESSPSTRCATPEEQSDAPLSASLSGWLHKRHTHEKNLGAQWARRYFQVNELRGTIAMSKGPKKKPSAILPLGDIKSVTLDKNQGVNVFVISCPPVHLTVRTDDRDECRHWLHQLKLRSDIWRAKAGATVTAASLLAPAAAEPAAQVIVEAAPPASDSPVATGEEAREDEPRHVSPVDERTERPAHESRRAAAASPPPIERTALETVELLSDDDDDDETEVEQASFGQFGQDSHTSKLHSSPPARVAPAPDAQGAAMPPPRDLESMLSSDEEEEEELARPMPVRRKPERTLPDEKRAQPALAPPSHRTEPASAPDAPEPAPLEEAAPAGEGGAMSWLQSLPDSAYEEPEPEPPRAAVAPIAVAPVAPAVPSAEAAAVPPAPPAVAAPPAAAANDYDDWDDEEEEATEPPSAANPVSIGNGIAADTNFVESDWDDDEE